MIEIPGLGAVRWRKSSYSGLENDCLEVADGVPGIVPVRDSKYPKVSVVALDADVWAEFVAGVKTGSLRASA
nr:DUF397 domain-containing protein [Streptomyces orinoci]